MNAAPPGFNPTRDLPQGLFDFVTPLHREFTPRQQQRIAKRKDALRKAHRGVLPDYLPLSPATTTNRQIELHAWCADQRNQMTGAAEESARR